jgi:hypothetical protein
MEYELGGKKFNLRNVCGKSLKVYKDLGLLQQGGKFTKEEQELIACALEFTDEAKTFKAIEILKRNPVVDEMEIYMNPEKLVKLIDATFIISADELKELDPETLNVEVVINGAFDFLKKCQPSSLMSEELLKTLMSSAMKTANSPT